MPMLSQEFSLIIDRDISATIYVREVLYVLNAIAKRFLFQLMATVKLPGANFMTHKWLFTPESVNLMLVWPDYFKNTCLMQHANME